MKSESKQMNRMKAVVLLLALACVNGYAQENNSSKGEDGSTSKEEGNRNVMLNATSANGPREIQIGLPSADVNVLENGIPVTYATNPHSVNSLWRADASLSHVGLLKISETAITTGNIGYAVNSFTQLGEKGFHGTLNYKTNHFGMQEVSLNLNGSLAKDWFYSGSIYQDFDPGTFKIKSTPFQDRTQIYKFALTKKYNDNRGELTAIYHYSNSHPVYNYATQSAPFVYVGDGSVREFGDFALGTTSYLPVDNEMVYRDMRTGELKKTNLYDASQNRGSEFTLMNNYTWDNGLNWKTVMKYDHSLGSLVYQTPMSLDQNEAGINYLYEAVDGSMQPYTGEYVQSRMSCLNRGFIDSFMFTTELSRKVNNSTWRLGLNEWYYDVDYTSSTTMYDQSVPMDGSYPVRLYNADYATYSGRTYAGSGCYYDFNKNASEYYKGHENKLALYFTHDWDITDKLNLYYGARLEYQALRGENAAVTNTNGEYVGRFANYYLGATAPDGTKIAPTSMSYDWLNYALTAAVTYKLTKEFGFTGDFTYITQHPKIENFAPATLPNTDKISVPLGRAGIYYNNEWLSLTSLFSYISKTNNNSTLNLQHKTAAGQTEIMAAPLNYDIKTLGWTTDVVARPFKGFDLHFLFTYQKPTYKKYETSVTFSDGYVGSINATGNIVAEIPEVIVEIDPSYMITKDLKIWTSFRYFSKTYANINDAYYFNGRWETFGGLNWQVNKKLALGCTVVNFLNQTGAKGSIAGAELIEKEDAGQYAGHVMAGSYIRPFTVEFSASLKF
ncbi:TonB-dependent receptor [Phocaeicola coprophilus]|uniref:TonB-dependent receptor n=2 Tax=Phocaeicola coprophilus TaxID=387090 RepID=A0A413SZU9_9BACT|nr:TonB-dependent receptor [Phocaeicola coprophilus]RHA75590.1 TonB-dependent receptor [Phocaeicola coprophilus]